MTKSHNFYYVDTMEYIKKCGRVNLPQDVLDKWLKMRVMMIIKDGKLDVHQLAGDPQDQLIELMDQLSGTTTGRLHVGITHGDLDPNSLKNRIDYPNITRSKSWLIC